MKPMPADSSNTQLLIGEAKKPQRPAKKPLARAYKLINRAAKKLAEIPDEYLDRALKRLGEQLDAVKLIWDVNAKEMVEIPDEKIRQDAAIMILAYKWGKPVERSITATTDFEDLATLQEKLRQSPAFLEHISSQKAVEAKEIIPALPEPQGVNTDQVVVRNANVPGQAEQAVPVS